MKKMIRNVTIAALSVTLCACSSFFDKDNTPTPAGLVAFTPEAKIQPVWYTSTGSGVDGEYLKLVPAITDQRIFTANKDGTVIATDKATGKTLWQSNTHTSLSAGPAAVSGLVIVGGRDGSVIALHQQNGDIVWQSKASSEILAAPTAAEGVVLVKSIDGKLSAFSETNGDPLWHYQQTEPSLILRGASVPQISQNAVYVGFANGTLSKLSLREGSLMWQQTVAIPEGSYPMQRMVDIDANPVIFDGRLFVATYQGRISALAPSTGTELWTYDISSYSGIAADQTRVYVSDAKSHIWAFDSESGAVDWRQPGLDARNITGPAVMGNYIVVGDAEGYLHWLNKKDGHFVARTKVSNGGIIAAPVVNNNILYVVTMDGHLAAYTVAS